MCDGEKVRHAWIYGGMCEIRPPVYSDPPFNIKRQNAKLLFALSSVYGMNLDTTYETTVQ